MAGCGLSWYRMQFGDSARFTTYRVCLCHHPIFGLGKVLRESQPYSFCDWGSNDRIRLSLSERGLQQSAGSSVITQSAPYVIDHLHFFNENILGTNIYNGSVPPSTACNGAHRFFLFLEASSRPVFLQRAVELLPNRKFTKYSQNIFK